MYDIGHTAGMRCVDDLNNQAVQALFTTKEKDGNPGARYGE
jgi:hypothetical protein